MRLRGNVDNLEYKTSGSAAFDLIATEDYTLFGLLAKSGVGFGFYKPVVTSFTVVKTGVFIESAEPDECLLIIPRSGLALKHGITVLNSPGLIDSDYRDEIGVILMNLSDKEYRVKRGDRIAQALLWRANKVDNVPINETLREGGFGSTGK